MDFQHVQRLSNEEVPNLAPAADKGTPNHSETENDNSLSSTSDPMITQMGNNYANEFSGPPNIEEDPLGKLASVDMI